MSRSKHIQTTEAAARRKPGLRTGVFLSRNGALRGGWILALTALGWCAATLGIRLGLTAAFNALFAAWGIDAGNARFAPGWARLVYGWHGSAVTAAGALAGIALALALRKAFALDPPEPDRPVNGARTALIGLGTAAMLAGVFLLADSLRWEWPLARPRFSAGLPALLGINLLSVLAGELITKRVAFDALRPRWGAGGSAVAATLLFFIGSGGYAGGIVAAINALLLGALCGLLYAVTGSLWAVTGLRWGWSAANLFLLGFGGGDYAVYRLYGVSENALTGGDAGLMYGLGATLLFLAGIAWLERGRLKAFVEGLRPRNAHTL